MSEKSEKLTKSEVWVEQRDIVKFCVDVRKISNTDQKIARFIF